MEAATALLPRMAVCRALALSLTGFPSFGGIVNGTVNKMYVDDVRIAADTSSVCSF